MTLIIEYSCTVKFSWVLVKIVSSSQNKLFWSLTDSTSVRFIFLINTLNFWMKETIILFLYVHVMNSASDRKAWAKFVWGAIFIQF